MIDQPVWTETELEWFRILLGMVLLIDWIWVVPGKPTNPRGVARWFDVGPIVNLKPLGLLCRVSSVLFAMGKFDPWVSVLLAGYLVLRLTAKASHGSVGHGWHLFVVVYVAMAAAQVHGFVLDLAGESVTRFERDANGAWWAIQAVVGVYFTSGVTKVAYTCASWFRRAPNLVLSVAEKRDLRRAHPTDASDAARPSIADRVVGLAIEHPAAARWIFGAGLAVELLSPVALMHRWALVAVGSALMLLHVANAVVLDINFKINQYVLVILFLNIPGQVLAG